MQRLVIAVKQTAHLDVVIQIAATLFAMLIRFALTAFLVLSTFLSARGAEPAPLDTSRGDKMIATYFRAETFRLRDRCLTDVNSLDEWKKQRTELRRQLLEMLSLDPMPKRTDLKATVTGTVERDNFIVRNIHFQSRPGLYVTGNLYLPKNQPLTKLIKKSDFYQSNNKLNPTVTSNGLSIYPCHKKISRFNRLYISSFRINVS